MKPDCPHRHGNTCELVKLATGAQFYADDNNCAACQKLWIGSPPTAEKTNAVLRNMIDAANRRERPAAPLVDFTAPKVGDRLKELIAARMTCDFCEACEAELQQMNRDGPEKCRRRIEKIVSSMWPRAIWCAVTDASLREVWAAAKSAGKSFGIKAEIRKLVNQAIDETEAAEQQRRPIDLSVPEGKSPRLAVVAALFNPANAQVLHDNWRTWRAHLQPLVDAGRLHSVTTVQLVWPGQERLGDIVIDAVDGQVAFQKEGLLRIGEASLPPEVVLVANLDADLIFESAEWPERAEAALESRAVVQLFDRVLYPESGKESTTAPGGAWAAHRSVLKHGLYTHAPFGGGDNITLAGWRGKAQMLCPTDDAQRHLREWVNKVSPLVAGRIGKIEGRVIHLFHGDRRLRRGGDRHRWLKDAGWNPYTDVETAPNGLLRWTRPDLQSLAESYFDARTSEYTGETRVSLLNMIAARRHCQSYLEIGCFADATFRMVSVPRKVGVDPERGGTHRMTSDAFFAQNTETFDLGLIDGLHHQDQVLRDVDNLLRCLGPHGVIVLHDCLPKEELHQRVPRESRTWNGDVWKAIVRLRTRPDIDVAVLDADQGLGIVLPRPNTARLESVPELTWDTYTARRDELLRVIPSVNQFLGPWLTHWLLTRFNVGIVDRGWLEHRIGLFKRYCLPSVLSQTMRPHRWLLVCDAATPTDLLEDIRSVLPKWGELVLANGRNGLDPDKNDWKELLAARLRASSTPWVISTRIDNDDAIGPQLLQTVQSQAVATREFLNPPHGLVMEGEQVAERIYRVGSPFLSLVEPTATAECVYSVEHGKASPRRDMPGEHPAWVQIVHGRNKLNRFTGDAIRGEDVTAILRGAGVNIL